MNHETAIASEAVERYLLDELSPEERDAFEEHYFDCEQCASAVRMGTALKINGQAVAKEAQRPSRPGQVTEIRPRPGKSKRLYWSSAIPAAAAAMLAVVVGYQTQVRTPQLSASALSPRSLDSAQLVHDAARGAEPRVIKLGSGESAVLALELEHPPKEPSFNLVVSHNGKPAREITNARLENGQIYLALPSSTFPPGSYEMLVRTPDKSEVGKFVFQLEK